MEPIYDDTYGGRALNLAPIEMNGTKKKKKKKKKHRKAHETKTISKRIDYILVYKHREEHSFDSVEEFEEYNKEKVLRDRFQEAMVTKERLEVQEETVGDHTYVKIHCPFNRLCKEAEDINLEMPLKGAAIIPNKKHGCIASIENRLKTDDELDFVSAPFCVQKRNIFDGIDDPETFFRSATRSYLTHHILINMDVRDPGDKRDKDSMRRKGLPYMILRGIYVDGFILHDESLYEDLDEDERDAMRKESERLGQFQANLDPRERKFNVTPRDPRFDMQRTWVRFFKYQPLWKIRNYYGEQIAFYFAWAGAFATYLWIPMLMGLAIWGYGLFLSIEDYQDGVEEKERQRELMEELQRNQSIYNLSDADESLLANLTQQLEDESLLTMITDAGLTVFKNSFDSDVTPYYALVICLWGTIFQEVWKRKRVRLAYEWDVDSYDMSEPDRPEFYGTKERPDPVSDLPDWYYPFYKSFLKFMASFGILVFMAMLVIVSVISVIIYRLFTAALLSDSDSVVQLLVSVLVSSLLNSISILILGKIYEKIAVKLNNWENHRTKSTYENALIVKLFAFQFVNSYSSLFYIAFFRDQSGSDSFLGIEGLRDSCTDNNCMSMLSLQVFVLMLVKPVPKFLKDVILPWLIRKFKKRTCCRPSQVKDLDMEKMSPHAQYLTRERNKPPVGDLTLGEYNEKVILYGFLMIFSSALPIAPLIAITVLLLDIRIDAKRLLWFNRRPVAFIASSIGMWFSILDFINFAGVISNAFIIAFTAQWGRKYSNVEKLWIVIGFEHIVFAVKFFIMYIIPDVPSDIALAMRREKFQVAKVLEDADTQPPMKSKDFMSRVIPNGSNFKGLNYYTSEVDRISSSCQSLEHSFNGSINYEASAADADDTYDREHEMTADRTELTYDENGDSYIANGNPPLLPPVEPVKKRKKKKKVKTPRSEPVDPDLPPLQGGGVYSIMNPNLAYPPNYGFHPSYMPDNSFNDTSQEVPVAYPLPVSNTFTGPF
ncbi:anoctamin-4-like isoform X2 [Lytechinus variegatus]|uniref:anoctamin-4-like isoform X2 n=1 Tax=Lytechinus variegatus TaxID=7654 RepID=UPI001BB1C693|nr:anoctamin-4-like isoform X2 [Lytechinus variegatus]